MDPGLRRSTIGAATSLVVVLLLAAHASEALALTPAQSTAAAMQARADTAARLKVQALAKAKADAEAKARADVASRTKVKILTLQSVHAETKRRVEAATKAAVLNAQVTSFRAGPPVSPMPRNPGSEPAKHDSGIHLIRDHTRDAVTAGHGSSHHAHK